MTVFKICFMHVLFFVLYFHVSCSCTSHFFVRVVCMLFKKIICCITMLYFSACRIFVLYFLHVEFCVRMLRVLCVLLATSQWGMSESRGGGVPNPENEPSGT